MDKIKRGIPSNERTEKIDKLISLQLLTRDHIIYMGFENLCEENKNVGYLFCEACRKRYNLIKYDYIRSKRTEHENNIEIEIKISNELENIDKELYRYLNSLFVGTFKSKGGDINGYTSSIIADAFFLKEALGKNRFNELHFYGTMYTNGTTCKIQRDMYPITLLEDDQTRALELLNNEDNLKIKEHIHKKHYGVKTIIKRDYKDSAHKYTDKPSKNSNVYVELDLNKPVKELTNFIETLKKDYTDTNKIQTIYDLVDTEEENTPFIAELHKHNIYKKNNRAGKSNIQLLADVLFVYDCIIAGYDLGSIAALFDNHYSPLTIDEDTLSDYYNFAHDFIDNQRYNNFTSGYSTSTE